MSRIYNKYVDQAIRSIEPTLGQEKTKEYKKKLKLKKLGVAGRNRASADVFKKKD
jgi:hypothetical protein